MRESKGCLPTITGDPEQHIRCPKSWFPPLIILFLAKQRVCQGRGCWGKTAVGKASAANSREYKSEGKGGRWWTELWGGGHGGERGALLRSSKQGARG